MSKGLKEERVSLLGSEHSRCPLPEVGASLTSSRTAMGSVWLKQN